MERAARLREESVMDLEIDFLAPYLERWQQSGALLTKRQVQEMREESMREIKADLEAKLSGLRAELRELNREIEAGIPDKSEENSKRFLAHLTEVRLGRQERYGEENLNKAARQWAQDQRIKKLTQ